MNEKLFALDIGTRSVVGIILEKQDNQQFKVIDHLQIEHKERAMLDGQIHNVLEVAQTIREIKNELEKSHGPLTEVCVAAAGRSLKTKRVTYERDVEQQPIHTPEDVFHMELAAVQQAQYELAGEQLKLNESDYYCVGYSVLHYYLDEEKINSLIDQQGKTASVEIISTFLPKVVVESLLSALQRADLEMEALTLEPIAAIQVLIPVSMRRLNVALVDIGAGTSDIAITKEGTVVAYGMVPKAGDEITEALSDHYLLDFPEAEQVKRKLANGEPVEITDILGFTTEVDYHEAVQSIDSAIDDLVNTISNEILRLNGKSPQAVMLVGGGSLTPELERKIAEKLGLPTNRVAIRKLDAIRELADRESLPDSPEWVTPIGIAIAAKESPVHYIHVTVNDKPVRLFDVKQLTVGDSLLAAGIELNKLYGKPGMAKIIELNGKSLTLPGTLGEPPTLRINGQETSIQTTIQHGDQIEVIRGQDGESPAYVVKDIIGDVGTKDVDFNGNTKSIHPEIIVNGQTAAVDAVLNDSDRIEWDDQLTVARFLHKLGVGQLLDKNHPFEITLNHRSVNVLPSMLTLLKNGTEASADDLLQDGDALEVNKQDRLTIGELCNELDLKATEEITVFFEHKPVTLKKSVLEFELNGKTVDEQTMIEPHDTLITKEKQDTSFIFQDVFLYIDIELTNIRGKRFQLYCNGEEVGFAHPLQPGDQLSIRWIESIEYHS